MGGFYGPSIGGALLPGGTNPYRSRSIGEILQENARQYEAERRRAQGESQLPSAGTPAITAPSIPASVPVMPGQTKDDLEPSRQGQTQPLVPDFADLGLSAITTPSGTGVPLRYPDEMGKEGPHIRYSLPSPGGGMGPMEDYDLNSNAPFAGQGGFMGAQGHPGGGAFSGSSTPVTGKTAMGNPEFDWSGVANREAFSGYTQPIRDAALAAERKRQEAMILDPMYEERQKADIWAGAQGKAQAGIREALYGEFKRKAADIYRAVMEDPAIPQDKKEEVFRNKIEEMSTLEGLDMNLKTPSVGGYGG